MSKFGKKLKQFLKLDDNIDNGNVDDACQARVNMNADEAYRLTRYGQVKSDNTLLVEFFDRVHRMISNRNAANKFFGLIDINIDIMPFLAQIKDKLTEMGYKVVVFDETSTIKTGETEVRIGNIDTFIMILWDLESIKEMKEKNAVKASDSSTSFQSDMTARSLEQSETHADHLKSDTDSEDSQDKMLGKNNE